MARMIANRVHRVARVRGIRDGIDTAKLASGWSGGGRERERVDALPLAHARGYDGDEVSEAKLASRWFDQRQRGSPCADRPHPLAPPLGKGQESSCFSQVSPFPGEPVTGTLSATVEFSGHAADLLKFFRSFLRLQCPSLSAYSFADGRSGRLGLASRRPPFDLASDVPWFPSPSPIPFPVK
jgi:hypothetical protein